MYELSATSILTALPETVEQQKKYIALVKESILSGDTNPLIISRQLKSFEDVIKSLRTDEEIKKYTIEEAQKHGKSFDFGAKFSLQDRKTWDYSECGDSVLNEAYGTIEKCKEIIKTREAFLKTITEPIALSGTGEVVIPPTFKSNEVLSITLNK